MIPDIKSIVVALGVMCATAGFVSADTIKVGLVLDLSDSSGVYPVADDVNGAKLAADATNQAGGVLGRSLELVVADTHSTPDGAAAAFAKLAAESGIVAFIGPDRSPFTHAIAPSALKTAKPVLFNALDPKLTHMGNPWLFRTAASNASNTRIMAEFGVGSLHAKRWAIIVVNDQYGRSGRDGLTEALRQRGLAPAVSKAIDNDAATAPAAMERFVQEAKSAGADIVASYLLADVHFASPVLLAKELHKGGLAAAWIGSWSTALAGVAERAGPDLNGAYAVVNFFAQSGPTAEAFARKFQATYGNKADEGSAWPFNSVNILANAITDTQSTDPDKLRAAILALHGFEGVQGTYDFDANGDGLRAGNILHRENGNWVFVKRAEAAPGE